MNRSKRVATEVRDVLEGHNLFDMPEEEACAGWFCRLGAVTVQQWLVFVLPKLHRLVSHSHVTPHLVRVLPQFVLLAIDLQRVQGEFQVLGPKRKTTTT